MKCPKCKTEMLDKGPMTSRNHNTIHRFQLWACPACGKEVEERRW